MDLIDATRRHRIIPERLDDWAGRTGDAPFVLCGPDWLSYADIARQSAAFAAGLHELGVRKGDRVGLILPNRPEMVIAMFALFRLGAIFVPFNTFLKGEFLRYQLGDCAAKVVISDAAGIGEIAKVAANLPDLRHVVNADGGAASPVSGAASVPIKVTGMAELMLAAPPVDAALTMSDVAAILYTSGTTGMPKGCVLSHGYCMGSPRGWYMNDWIRAGDRLITPMPLFHGSGTICILMPALQAGLSAVFDATFSARGYMARAKEVGATYTMIPGPMAKAMLATPESDADRDHSLRLCATNPMHPADQVRFEQRFGTKAVTQVYGQTEAVPVSLGPWTDDFVARGRAGRPLPWFDVRLVSETGADVADGEPGEILVRAREPEIMFQGYWGLTPSTAANDWHATGDMAALEDGALRFVDRKKDAMRRRGENVSSFELERAIGTHPDVDQVAVHAVASALGEDEIKACIVAAPGSALTPEILFLFLRDTVPYFAIPRFVELVAALPINAMGRVMKSALREHGVGEAWDFEALGLTVDKHQRR